jgi:hypothetical protein
MSPAHLIEYETPPRYRVEPSYTRRPGLIGCRNCCARRDARRIDGRRVAHDTPRKCLTCGSDERLRWIICRLPWSGESAAAFGGCPVSLASRSCRRRPSHSSCLARCGHSARALSRRPAHSRAAVVVARGDRFSARVVRGVRDTRGDRRLGARSWRRRVGLAVPVPDLLDVLDHHATYPDAFVHSARSHVSATRPFLPKLSCVFFAVSLNPACL